MTKVEQISPLHDPRWAELVQVHPRASAFHSPGWLEALRRTYGYEPVVYTTSRLEGELTNGVVFCQVKSWLTGHRMVSLPFSDHCEPLVSEPEDWEGLRSALQQNRGAPAWNYVELRPLNQRVPDNLECVDKFHFHTLDLTPEANQLFRRFHKDCVQRKIRRAEREGLTYERGRSEGLLRNFYRLLAMTRRRHQLLPQPYSWFRNLVDCLGDQLSIRVACKLGLPIASILTLRFKDTLIYKYGCSDARFHNMGGMHLLFWRAIQEAKTDGLREFDLGRSSWSNEGLATFKDRWGATRSTLAYWRYRNRVSEVTNQGWGIRVSARLFAAMPDRISSAAGKVFYRHFG